MTIRKIDIRHFVFYPLGVRGPSGLGSARASRAGEGVRAFANFWNGPDWARTSDPALIKRML
jgi:hypothetical protein